MKISDAAIDRRTTVFVLLGLLIAMGMFSYSALPRESEPEIIIPIALVNVVYQGVSPEDMENLVTMPIERKLTGIGGIKQIRSTTNEGLSTIIVEFQSDVDVAEAIQKVRDKIDLAKADLPPDADEPIVRDVNTAESPVVLVSLTGAIGLAALTQIAEDLEDEIEALPGILNVDIIGKVEREIQIEVDPIRAGLYGVSLPELARLAAAENVNTPAGSLEIGEAKYLVRVPGEIKSVEDIRNLVVRRGDTGVVYLRDLAEVKDGTKDATTYSRLDSISSVTLVATKRANVNIIKVAESVKDILEEARAALPPGVQLDITLDESERIAQMVRQLENSIFTGLMLVLFVTFLALGTFNAIFVSLAIPVSMLIAFSCMYFSGYTFNMVTLFSLMVSLGMLVDNGIVVVENIYRHAQTGLSRIEAAKQGTREVAWPVFGSTLTTVVAFLPMVFWPGMMGRFLSLLPKTVIITLFASLFVGLIVNPALASVFVQTKKTDRIPLQRRYPILYIFLPITLPIKLWRAAAARAGTATINLYERVLRLALQWRAVTIVTAVTMLVVIIAVFAANPKTEFLADSEPDRAFIDIEMPEGTNLNTTNDLARQIESIVRAERGKLDFILASIGSRGPSIREGGMPGNSSFVTASHLSRVTLVFPQYGDREELSSSIIRRVRGLFDDITGADISFGEAGVGVPSGAAVHIELSGEDFDVLGELTADIEEAIQDVNGLVDLKNDFDRGKPEVRIIIDREQAALAKLNTQYIGAIIQAAIHGRKAGEYREGEDEYDVIVRFPKLFTKDLSYAEGMTFVNADGMPIPFRSVARLEQGLGIGSIQRVDRKRTVTIKANAEGRSGTEVLADVQDTLEDMVLPTGYTITYAGENEEAVQSGIFLVRAFGVALFLIALVLITQFNSIIQPAIIMSSVFLSLAGVFFGLVIFDMPFGFLMTGIGCVSLSGIVVNNAIVLVDYINKLRDRGRTLEEAIVEAGKTRFRPVLLTAVTTILGLLPLGLAISFDFRKFELVVGGEQASYWGSMAVAIIFGLSFATVLTLLVVPTLYSLSESVSAVFRKNSDESPGDPEQAEPLAD